MTPYCKVFDVADYFLCLQDSDCGDYISNLKLQKLCYYAQGFSLALTNERLFDNDIEAWQHGPAIPELYNKYKQYGAGALPISEEFRFDGMKERCGDLLGEIYQKYGQYSAWRLRDMTHCEPPWLNARRHKQRVITDADMTGFFKTRLI
jgi:uncharacterized phage-associated protein